MTKTIQLPEFSMVLLVGPTGSGKSTFARRNFAATEVVSSDQCRAAVADDPHSQAASRDAFELLHHILAIRLRNRRLSVVDATNLQPEHRRTLLDIAQENDCRSYAIAFNLTLAQCLEQNRQRTDRQLDERVVRHHHRQLRQALKDLRRDRTINTIALDSPAEAASASVARTPLRSDHRNDAGPFDIIGDVHGCHQELLDLLAKLGYATDQQTPTHPEGRRAIFLGDLVDRGPASDRVLQTVQDMTQAGQALCVSGNHEDKLLRHLRGHNVRISHGLERTIEQLEAHPPEFREQVKTFLQGLNYHYWLDDGRLAVAHAGVLAEYQGRNSPRVRDFCLYGQTTGETDEWGLPVRYQWALDYRARPPWSTATPRSPSPTG